MWYKYMCTYVEHVVYTYEHLRMYEHIYEHLRMYEHIYTIEALGGHIACSPAKCKRGLILFTRPKVLCKVEKSKAK